MSVADLISQSLPEACDSRVSSPLSTILEAEKNDISLQMSSVEALYSDTVSPLPASIGLLLQDSPDSSTSPKVKLPTSIEKSTMKEGKGLGKKQKVRTVFSQMQLCILKDRFQKQKYLSLQQMQELSEVLNLSYKQVKTWFQNQRMKCKRWQKNTKWPNSSNGVAQKVSVPAEYLDLCASYHQGYLPSGNLPMWSNQTWSSQTWSNQTWSSSQAWCTQAWNNQSWNTQAWNNQSQICGEEFLLPQFQQNSASDLEASQTIDLFLNDSMNIQPEEV
ncbi:PREDICTED: homeobox protein NANOG [Chrysochloris asiatica]|uniref:Homeobox protein NANOG n=1 Tax=Chrysochloris asiatica TaxID=185453 RepID=A0A9B0X0M4_CHRAS|nr:PREDICTED: homeobox protein NANOG [Chrysochloris asiatica]